MGTILGWGEYAVDRMPAPGGTLVFPGDVVTTAAGGGAELKLITGVVARLDASSEVSLAGAAGYLDLRQGSLTVRSAGGQPAHARVLGATVVVGAGSPSICRLEAGPKSAVVAAVRGGVRIEAAGRVTAIPAGGAARLEIGRGPAAFPQSSGGTPSTPPQAVVGSPSAASASSDSLTPSSIAPARNARSVGRVVASYPDEVVRHPGAEIATPLRLGELVGEGDTLGTVGGGRVRIQLLDDGLVDLGVATTVHVVQHDPDVHSTELDLRAGHLRADVGALVGRQARFGVRTPLLQVSASATMIFVSADTKDNAVCNAGSGPVTVRSSGGAAGGTMKVGPGECSVTRPGEPLGASLASTVRIEREMSLASYEAGPGIPQIERWEGLKQARTATLSGVAVFNAVLFIQLYRTASDLQHAGSEVGPFVAALDSAAINLGEAIQLEHNLCQGFLNYLNDFGRVVSPSAPPPSCPNSAP